METISVLLAFYEGGSAGPLCIPLIYKGPVIRNYGVIFAVGVIRLEIKISRFAGDLGRNGAI